MEWIGRVDWHDLLWLGLLSLALGELRVNNTWDYPTYLLLALAGLVIVYYARGCAMNWESVLAPSLFGMNPLGSVSFTV